MTKLIFSWALLGGISLALILSILSVTGVLKFVDDRNRNRLFFVLVVQILLAGILFFQGSFQPAPATVVGAIEQPLRRENLNLTEINKKILSNFDHTMTELEKAKRENSDYADKAKAAEQDLVKASLQLEEQKRLITRLQEAPPPVPIPPAPVEDHSQELNSLKTRVVRAEAEAEESRRVADTLGRKLKEDASRIASLDQVHREKERQIQRTRATGRVVGVNEGWNFVIVDLGDKQGAERDSTLIVLRGGQQIAKVRISSVEPSTSVADVIRSTVRKGAKVQPGDSVIFEGKAAPPVETSRASQSALISSGESSAASLPIVSLPPLPQ